MFSKALITFFTFSVIFIGSYEEMKKNTEEKMKNVKTVVVSEKTYKDIARVEDFKDVYSYESKRHQVVEIKCLAQNIYHEARGTSTKEQIAVAMVTKNRVISKDFPKSFCEVVYQPYQFSWVDQGKRKINDKTAWEKAVQIATKVYYNKIVSDPTKGATHYYAPKLIKEPKWARQGYDIVRLEEHKYFKLN